MSDHTSTKLDRCASIGVSNTANAINTHTAIMINHIEKGLLNYVKKTEEGDIDAQNHEVINLLDPVNNSHAVSLRYFKTHKPRPVICITAEAVGPILANTACFSFGAKAVQAGALINVNGGVVSPTNGRIVYMTACSLNANGGAASSQDVSFGIIGDGKMGAEPGLIVSIPKNTTKGTKTITDEYKILEGAVLNFYSLNNSGYSRIAIVSAFVELNI